MSARQLRGEPAASRPKKTRALHPAASAAVVSADLRRKIARSMPHCIEEIRASLRLAELGAQGPDPEAGLVQIQFAREECDRILALWPNA